MKQHLMLYVEWGAGSETYDFHRQMVMADEGKILRIYPPVINEIVWMLRGVFRCPRRMIHYGYGYDNRDVMWADLDRRRISDLIGRFYQTCQEKKVLIFIDPALYPPALNRLTDSIDLHRIDITEILSLSMSAQ